MKAEIHRVRLIEAALLATSEERRGLFRLAVDDQECGSRRGDHPRWVVQRDHGVRDRGRDRQRARRASTTERQGSAVPAWALLERMSVGLDDDVLRLVVGCE